MTRKMKSKLEAYCFGRCCGVTHHDLIARGGWDKKLEDWRIAIYECEVCGNHVSYKRERADKMGEAN